MKNKKILSLFCACIMVLSLLVFPIGAKADDQSTGTTYYVSASTGNDNNSGTSASQPFYSLEKINQLTLQPGDRVLLQAGDTFNGYLHLKDSGSVENNILVDAYYGSTVGKAAVDAQGYPAIRATGGVWYQQNNRSKTAATNIYPTGNANKNCGYVSSALLLYDTSFVEVSNLEISNLEPAVGVSATNTARMDKAGVSVVAHNSGTVQHVYLNNLYIHEVQGNVLHENMHNSGIFMSAMEPAADNGAVARFNDIKIENCQIRDVVHNGISVGYTYNAPRFNTQPVPEEVATTYGHTNVVVRNNTVQNVNGKDIVVRYCFEPVVENNTGDPSGDYSIHSTSYMVDDDTSGLYVPSGVALAEIQQDIVVDAKASVHFERGGQAVEEGAVANDITLVVTAENGERAEYPLYVKNTYVYTEDYSTTHQGNVWFYQHKVGGEYVNLPGPVDEWDCWPGTNYGTVGMSNGWGLISDANEEINRTGGYSIAYRAPVTGNLTLHFDENKTYLRQASTSRPCSGDVFFKITLNGETVGEVISMPKDGSPVTLEPVPLNVEKGDYVRMELYYGSGQVIPGSIHIKPIVAYTAVDKTALQELYNQGLGKNENDYTQESWQVFAEAMNKAAEILQSEQAEQAAVDSMVQELEAAMALLEEKPAVDKTALEALYNGYKDTANDNYTEDSWNTFQNALTEAKTVLDNVDATQQQVDDAQQQLQTAYDGLAKQPGPGDVEVESVKINLGALTNLKFGKPLQLNVSINPSNATDKTLIFTSSNNNVLTIDANGVVTGVKPGTARITATAHNGVSHTVTIRVTA